MNKKVTDYKMDAKHPYVVRFMKEFGVLSHWETYTKRFSMDDVKDCAKLIDVVSFTNFSQYLDKNGHGHEHQLFRYMYVSTAFKYYLLTMHSDELNSNLLLYKQSFPMTILPVNDIEVLLELGKKYEEIKDEVHKNVMEYFYDIR